MGVHNASTTYIIHGDRNDHKTIDADSFVVMNRLLFKERTNYAQDDYFSRSSPLAADASDSSSSGSSNGTPVNPSCRYIMAKWCIGLCKYCGYDREMVASIMSCVDRFVATSEGSIVLRNRDRYQLAVMASLYLVSKVQQTQALEPESMAKLSRGKYTKGDIEAMELTILTELGWRIHPPTPLQFAREFVRHVDLGVLPGTGCFDSHNGDDDSSMETDGGPPVTTAAASSPLSAAAATEQRILELVGVQIEEATCDYELGCLTPPSRVAFGALSNALQSLGVDPSGPESMRTLNKRLLQQTTKQSNNTMGAAAVTDVSAALLKVVSSSDSSNSSLTNLLIQKCCGRNNNNNNQTVEQQQQQQQQSASSSFTKTTSSACVHSSPRTIVNDGIGIIV